MDCDGDSRSHSDSTGTSFEFSSHSEGDTLRSADPAPFARRRSFSERTGLCRSSSTESHAEGADDAAAVGTADGDAADIRIRTHSRFHIRSHSRTADRDRNRGMIDGAVAEDTLAASSCSERAVPSRNSADSTLVAEPEPDSGSDSDSCSDSDSDRS